MLIRRAGYTSRSDDHVTGCRLGIRSIQQIIEAIPASDGAGVRLFRSLGQGKERFRVDPFLMLDEFGSDSPDDYIAGFPPHPHRGFETVTYMLEGQMLHEDHMGNRGELGPGGAQWMTAGRGIIHSEMPQQEEGRMRGFQLWLNLPAAEKMQPASYRDIEPAEIPSAGLPGGGSVRVLAGSFDVDGQTVTGPITGKSTEPLYYDLRLAPDQDLEVPVDAALSGFLYVYEGAIETGPAEDPTIIRPRQAGVLGAGAGVRLLSGADGAQLLLIAGKPIGEPVAQYGPIVMNTAEEIETALQDLRDGTLVG